MTLSVTQCIAATLACIMHDLKEWLSHACYRYELVTEFVRFNSVRLFLGGFSKVAETTAYHRLNSIRFKSQSQGKFHILDAFHPEETRCT